MEKNVDIHGVKKKGKNWLKAKEKKKRRKVCIGGSPLRPRVKEKTKEFPEKV